jgi:hypothetical protein
MACLGPDFISPSTLRGIALLSLVSCTSAEEGSLQCYLKDHLFHVCLSEWLSWEVCGGGGAKWSDGFCSRFLWFTSSFITFITPHNGTSVHSFYFKLVRFCQ